MRHDRHSTILRHAVRPFSITHAAPKPRTTYSDCKPCGARRLRPWLYSTKVARLEHHVGRRSCGSSDMWTCQKMAQWGPIAEDDDLAGRKCEKGASPSTDKLESLSHDAATTCAFVMMRPIANARLLLSQRISGCNRAPLWHFLTPGRRNSAIGMHGNQRQSSQRTSDAQMPLRRGHVCQASKNKRAEAAT